MTEARSKRRVLPLVLSLKALRKLQIIARNSDWFTPLFAPVVIGWKNYFGIAFRKSFENRFILKVIKKSPLV